MTAATFDSHKYAKRLLDAGLPPAVADVQAETMSSMMAELAGLIVITEKQEIKVESATVKSDSKLDRMDAKIDRVEAKLEAKISEAKAELVRWVVGVGVLQMALIAALVLKLVK